MYRQCLATYYTKPGNNILNLHRKVDIKKKSTLKNYDMVRTVSFVVSSKQREHKIYTKCMLCGFLYEDLIGLV